jgi:hypothetical protein
MGQLSQKSTLNDKIKLTLSTVHPLQSFIGDDGGVNHASSSVMSIQVETVIL